MRRIGINIFFATCVGELIVVLDGQNIFNRIFELCFIYVVAVIEKAGRQIKSTIQGEKRIAFFFGTRDKNGTQTMKVASRAHLLSNRVNQMLQGSSDCRKSKH